MKAITLWQPYATLILMGIKQYETRSWATNYRGPIAIHAAKKNDIDIEMITRELLWEFNSNEEITKILTDPQPHGAIICTAELVNVWHIVCHPGTNIDIAKDIPIGAESLTEDKHDPHFGDYFVPNQQELALGDWTPGRYAWELRNIKVLDDPVQVKGQQGLWNWNEVKI